MSDNRTTELREELTERGVEFTTDDFNYFLTTNWWVDEIYAKYLEGTSKSYADEDGPVLELRIKRVTPEQAIAATLGSDASAVRLAERLRSIADEMRGVGASSMTPHELLACYARDIDKVADSLMFAATLGNERIKSLEKLIRDMYLDLLAEMPESLLEDRLIQMGELGIEVIDE